MDNYMNGLNVGGWISQYFNKSFEHFDSFIVEKDFEKIASWGFDHIRLPFDYEIIENDDNPFVYSERGFKYIDNAVSWASKYGISLLLDMHSAPGFNFGNHETSTLFSDRFRQERFLKLWQAITMRYSSEKHLAFDLLNEIVLPSPEPWNKLAAECISSIRKIDSGRFLIFGGINYNSIFTLKDIEIENDENVAYTFHFYEPILFTHQKAVWMPFLVHYNQVLNYPGTFDNLEKLVSDVKEGKIGDIEQFDVNRYLSKELDISLMVEDMQPALDFINKTGRKLYCGEFGVIESTPMRSRINWCRDAVSLFKRYKIGRSYWTYKGMDFGLLDRKGNLVSEDLVRVLSGRR